MALPLNLSVNADAQRVRSAARPTLSGRRLLLRYASDVALGALAVILSLFLTESARADVVLPPFAVYRACVAFESASDEMMPIGRVALETLLGVERPEGGLEDATAQVRSASDATAGRDWKRVQLLRHEIARLRPTARSIYQALSLISGTPEVNSNPCPENSAYVSLTIKVKVPSEQICQGERRGCWVICRSGACSFRGYVGSSP